MMSAVVLYMSMSLDGYIAGPNQSQANGLGDGGARLHEWIFSGTAVPDDLTETTTRLAGPNQQVTAELMSTGSVVTGRGTFEAAGAWGGDHHAGVPIFVVQRRPEQKWSGFPLVNYVSDIRTAVESAKHAAGDKNVLMHGATVARLALEAGVLDELEIHLVPVLLGTGRRLFDNLPQEHIELERVRVLEGDAGMIHLHDQVNRPT
jgi:dihydrofolate reductase